MQNCSSPDAPFLAHNDPQTVWWPGSAQTHWGSLQHPLDPGPRVWGPQERHRGSTDCEGQEKAKGKEKEKDREWKWGEKMGLGKGGKKRKVEGNSNLILILDFGDRSLWQQAPNCTQTLPSNVMSLVCKLLRSCHHTVINNVWNNPSNPEIISKNST